VVDLKAPRSILAKQNLFANKQRQRKPVPGFRPATAGIRNDSPCMQLDLTPTALMLILSLCHPDFKAQRQSGEFGLSHVSIVRSNDHYADREKGRKLPLHQTILSWQPSSKTWSRRTLDGEVRKHTKNRLIETCVTIFAVKVQIPESKRPRALRPSESKNNP